MGTKVFTAVFLFFAAALVMSGCDNNSAKIVKPGPGKMTAASPLAPKSELEKLGPGDHSISITSGGYLRKYIIHVPPGYDGSKPMAVVMMLHGGGGLAKAAMSETDWPAKADKEEFLAVFPEGLPADPSKPGKFAGNPQTWNDGSGRFVSGALNVDDVGFIRAVLDDVATRCAVNQLRIFVTGFSNGSSMTYRSGLELSQRVAAIAPISGHFWIKDPRLANPVPMLSIFGLNDPLNPTGGGEVTSPALGGSLGYRPPLVDSIMKWVNLLECKAEPSVILDTNGVKGTRFSGCNGGTEVIYYTIEGMGHTWPGGKSLLPESIVGKATNKLNANDVIWEFFKITQKPDKTTAAGMR